MKILVVGGAGYVGSTTVYRLVNQGHDVTVLDNFLFGGESLVPLIQHERVKLVRGDIRSPETVNQFVKGHDAICLLAAIVGEPACNRDTNLAVETNLHGARNVIQSALEHRVDRFVFISTCSNYGVVASDEIVNEQSLLNPISTYAETKVAIEEELLATNRPDFHPTILRLSTAFGISPRMRFDLMVSDFAKAAIADKKIVVYGEQFWRPFVHVEDIALAIDMVVKSDRSIVSRQVFNVGDNANNLQKLDLANLVRDYAGNIDLQIVQRNNDPRSYRVDFTKIQKCLGFKAQWSVQDGVREIVDALRLGIWKDLNNPNFYN